MPPLRLPVLPSSKHSGLSAIRDGLLRAGYSEEALRSRLGLSEHTSVQYFGALADPPLPRDDGSPLDLLIDLFLSGARVSKSAAEGALAKDALQAMQRVKLLVPAGRDYRATAAVLPLGALYFCCDFPSAGEDRVCFPDPSALVGLRLMEPGLDEARSLAICLQSGFGLHAVTLKAVHGYEVVQAHGGPRARQLTALNAAINGVKVDVRSKPPEALRSADVVMANLPGMFRASRLWSNHAPGEADEEALDQTWRSVDGLLNATGRALLCHETRLSPPSWLAQKIATRLGLGVLEVVWVPARGLGPGDDDQIEHGVTVVRRLEDDSTPLMRAGSILGQPGTSGRSLELHVRTRRLLRELDDSALGTLVPYRNARAHPLVSLDSWGATMSPREVMVGPARFPPQAAALLERCDNARTVAEICEEDAEALRLLRSLAQEGALFFRLAE